MSALRPVARSSDQRSAVVGSQLGMSGRYIWQRLGLSTFHSSSSRLFLWLGQGHYCAAFACLKNVPYIRLEGVRATRLHASGTGDSRLLLKVRDSDSSRVCTCKALVFRAVRAARIILVLTHLRTYIHSYSRIGPSFALPDSRLLNI